MFPVKNRIALTIDISVSIRKVKINKSIRKIITPTKFMTPLLSCQFVSKSFGSSPLFSDISLTLNEKERLGLIGPNGSGKSTLLKMMAGLQAPDSGDVSVKKDIKSVYLPQEDRFIDQDTVEDVLEQRLADEGLEDAERYSRIQKWLARARFENPGLKARELSGGWQKRLSIVSCLILEPDLLFLDEPTNHLDIEGIYWLEELLKDPDFAFVLVTHDRYFLENVTNRMVELNRQFPKGFIKVEGSYSEFLIYREAELDNQLQLETVLSNKLKRETEWLRRGPKARTSKARFRIEEAYRLREEHSSVRKRNLQERDIGFDFDGTQRKTKKLLVAENIGKAMGHQRLFERLNLVLSPGSCIGLLGRNGTGKSTLVSILSGSLKPDEGKVRTADHVKIAIFEQNRQLLNQEQILKEALAPTGDSVVYRGKSVHVNSWAKRFLFQEEKLEMPVSQLSGGEQARIMIAELMQQPADILFLDEPTNDLDISSLEVLENAIRDFPGAVVLVTHDRFLLDRLTTGVIGFDGLGNATHYADHSQWLANMKAIAVEKKQQRQKTGKTKATIRKLTYKEQLELQKIESWILAAELEVETLKAQVQTPEIMNDPDQLQTSCSLLQNAQEKVETLYARWEELEAIEAANNDS